MCGFGGWFVEDDEDCFVGVEGKWDDCLVVVVVEFCCGCVFVIGVL